jgi:hypothetical protein
VFAITAAVTVSGPMSAAQAATSPVYAFEKIKLASGRSIVARWNPCQEAITYRINLTALPTAKRAAMRKQIRAAFRTLSAANGITYRYTGTTRFVPKSTNLTKAPAEIVVAVVGNKATDMDLAANVAGLGGMLWSTWTGSAGEGAVVVRGFVLLSPSEMTTMKPGFGRGSTQGNVILHELAHASGLEHVSAKSELMYPTLLPSAPNGFGPGDLAGLKKIGKQGGCVKVSPAVRVTNFS